jgi:light-regulated signal transduction histidine kinase (bacteriophytochrome)
LVEPLRTMQCAAKRLSRCYGASVDDEEMRSLMVSIVDGADRMQMLVGDLLEYSRATDELPERTAVDCRDLVRDAVDALNEPINETHAAVVWGWLPVVHGHRTQLGQVFQNLLSNSVKYSSKGKRPIVRIDGTRERYAWRLTVEDNGIGIDPRHADRVFEMFRRLNGDDPQPGTGIGLALCRRIVEHHGGRIWYEPRPDGGSVFNFTIPDGGSTDERAEVPVAR